LERLGIAGRVEMLPIKGNYRTYREIEGEPLVSVVIPTRGSSGSAWHRPRCFVVEALRGIAERSTYSSLEFVVVADEPTPPEVQLTLSAMLGDRLRWVEYQKPFNFADKINVGVVASDGEYVVLLNDDIDLITPDWIETMLGIAQQSDIGLVGAKLYFEDDTVQHIGHCYWHMAPGHIGFGADRRDPGPLAEYFIDREVSGVTGACAMLRRDVFFEVGGLSYALPSNYNDVDLSLKIRQTGRRVVVTPHVELYHFESKSRAPEIRSYESAAIRARWARLMNDDPYWRWPVTVEG
jgi:GT2 family glycosyltransferase